MTTFHPTAAFHHAQLEQGVIRILLAAPTFPSPSTTITATAGPSTRVVAGGAVGGGPSSSNSAAGAGAGAATVTAAPGTSFSRASTAAVHLLSEIFHRILAKYAADAARNCERERRNRVGWGDVVRAVEGVGGAVAMEELMEWCLSRGQEGGDEAAAEAVQGQRLRLEPAKDAYEDGDETAYHFAPLPDSLIEARDMLDERDCEAREAARYLDPLAAYTTSDEEEDTDVEELEWPLKLLYEAERELNESMEQVQELRIQKSPLAILPAETKPALEEPAQPISKQVQEEAVFEGEDAPMDIDQVEDVVTADVTKDSQARPDQEPAVPAPPKSTLPRVQVPAVPSDASLLSGANSYLTPASTLTGSSTDPALLHMGKQRRTMALVLSDPQRYGPAPSLYGAAPPARSGAEPGSLPFVPGPSLLITLPRPGAPSAAPYFTPVHPYGRAAGGAGAPPQGSLTSVARHNSDLFLASRTVCEPSLLRRATRTEDPAPLLDESFAERVFQGWPAERDLLEQAALGRGVLAPAVRVLKRQKELKRLEEGGARKKKKRRRRKKKIMMAGGKAGAAKGGGGGAGGGRPGAARAARNARAQATNRPGKGKSRSIYVDDYDEHEFDELLDDDGGGGDDDGAYGSGRGSKRGAGRRASAAAARLAAAEASTRDDDDDAYMDEAGLREEDGDSDEYESEEEDEELKAPESGMLVHTWDWQNRDYADGQLAAQRGLAGTGTGAAAVAGPSTTLGARGRVASSAAGRVGSTLHPNGGASAGAGVSTPASAAPTPTPTPATASAVPQEAVPTRKPTAEEEMRSDAVQLGAPGGAVGGGATSAGPAQTVTTKDEAVKATDPSASVTATDKEAANPPAPAVDPADGSTQEDATHADEAGHAPPVAPPTELDGVHGGEAPTVDTTNGPGQGAVAVPVQDGDDHGRGQGEGGKEGDDDDGAMVLSPRHEGEVDDEEEEEGRLPVSVVPPASE